MADNSNYISIARTPADLYEDKRKGRKSIMFGIENGLALNHDLANVRHFAQRGVIYITLCHNGDNDICDSNKGSQMNNGVSEFGAKVIQRMNDEGIMVDLSHANEKSFYDALDISRTPIVCTHTCCRALCDVPRNLTDDQACPRTERRRGPHHPVPRLPAQDRRGHHPRRHRPPRACHRCHGHRPRGRRHRLRRRRHGAWLRRCLRA